MLRKLFRKNEATKIGKELELARAELDSLKKELFVLRSGKSTSGNELSDWFFDKVGSYIASPNTWPAASWHADSEQGLQVLKTMTTIERDCAASLFAELDAQNIRGPVIEFGVSAGYWMSQMINICEVNGFNRDFYGLDSFMGLPAVSQEHDLECFVEGQFSADLAAVSEFLEVGRRPNVKLIPGWFSETIPSSELQALREISYARVDCDLYGPALECLQYLGPRLAHGAILVFDDWTFDLSKGETRAFAEWLPTRPDLTFEFLFYSGVGQFYLRTRKHDKSV